MADKIPRVLIVVEGGVVQSVLADGLVKVCIKDFDNIKEGDAAGFLNNSKDAYWLTSPITGELLDEKTVENVATYLPDDDPRKT